jgi:hypothetical protein
VDTGGGKSARLRRLCAYGGGVDAVVVVVVLLLIGLGGIMAVFTLSSRRGRGPRGDSGGPGVGPGQRG